MKSKERQKLRYEEEKQLRAERKNKHRLIPKLCTYQELCNVLNKLREEAEK